MASNAEVESQIPSWLTEKTGQESSEVNASGTHFIARTLHNFSKVFENEFFSERYAAMPKLFQSIDPRVKFVILLVFMLFSAFCSNIPVLLFLVLIAVFYAKLSGLDMKDYIRRSWAYIPPLVFILSLPGSSSLFVRGVPLFHLLSPGAFGLKSGLYFSANGLYMALRLALRPGISLSFGFLLLLTTKWPHITGALASMHVPKIFISILNMAYRYIFVISEMAAGMIEARSLRTIGRLKTSDNRKFMSRSIASLFIRSHFLSNEIYDAMICRGYTGKQAVMNEFKIKSTDILFIANNLIILLLLIAGEYIF